MTDVDNTPRMAEEICPGFPDKCPNIKTVEPDPPAHYGGIRCGCADQPPAAPARLTVDTITSDQLDDLLAERDMLRRNLHRAITEAQIVTDRANLALTYRDRAFQYRAAWHSARRRARGRVRAEAAIARVRALHTPNEEGECRDCCASFDPCPTIAALDEPSDSARHCGGTLTHPGHKFMRLDVVFNCPGDTPKEPTP